MRLALPSSRAWSILALFLVVHGAGSASGQVPGNQRPNAPALPPRPRPEARYLILIAHGWRSNANVWATAMANDMANTIPPADLFQWHIVPYSWAAAANTLLPNGSIGPAESIGGQLAATIRAPFPGGYDRVHVLGHSAGSHLVNAIADGIQDDRAVQITFFDAYEPNGGNQSNLGRRASLPQFTQTFAEQYVDFNEMRKRDGTDQSNTNETLQFACNLDITGLDDRGLHGFVNAHAWPYVFYGRTVIAPGGVDATRAAGWGFARAMVLNAGLQPPSHQMCPRGTRTVYSAPPFAASAIASEPRSIASDPVVEENPLVLSGFMPSPTGSVQLLQPTRLQLTSGPGTDPVWFTLAAVNGATATHLTFQWEFTTQSQAGEGWLALYVDRDRNSMLDDRDLCFQVDELYATQGQHSQIVPLQVDESFELAELAPGSTLIGFRIDPQTSATSQVVLGNVRFGRAANPATLVPAQSHVLLVATAALVVGLGSFFIVRRQRRTAASNRC